MGKTVKNQSHKKLYENIKALLRDARSAVVGNINTAMVMTYNLPTELVALCFSDEDGEGG
jgi:hypothetical protein